MERRVKFALKMADGVEVRNIDDLKAHFDIDLVTEYFFDGRLLTWLEDRYYDAEAKTIRNLNKNDDYLAENLCAIFDVETEEEIVRCKLLRVLKALLRVKRIERLKKYTNDKKILVNVDKVAFDQEELAYLLDEDAKEIFLCENRFVIPLRMKNKNYIGVGKAIAIIRSKEPVDFEKLNITFKNVAFDDDYQKISSTRIAKNMPRQNSESLELRAEETTINRNEITKAEVVASVFIDKAKSFKSKIRIKANGKTVDAKSASAINSLWLRYGEKITIIAEGSDAKDAVSALKELIDSKLWFKTLKPSLYTVATNPTQTFNAPPDYVKVTTTIENRTGIHARPASVFVQKASSFQSKILLKAKGKVVDAKSILMLISLGLTKGTEITIFAEGPDAKEAIDALKALVDSKFGEE